MLQNKYYYINYIIYFILNLFGDINASIFFDNLKLFNFSEGESCKLHRATLLHFKLQIILIFLDI
jgi:hypothetical protein